MPGLEHEQFSGSTFRRKQHVHSMTRRIETAYDGQGNAYLVTSYDAASGGSVVSQVQRAFDGLGQLTTEWQQHGGAVSTGTSPKVQYAYSFSGSGSANQSRLPTVTAAELRRRLLPPSSTLPVVAPLPVFCNVQHQPWCAWSTRRHRARTCSSHCSPLRNSDLARVRISSVPSERASVATPAGENPGKRNPSGTR